MTRRYVTLFDSTYLVKGALMLDSLARRSAAPPEVVVVALDDRVAALPWAGGVRAVPVAALEAEVPGLAAARATRAWREYCWTLASVALRWRLAQLAPGELLTYVDADLGFFSDPEACFAELGDRSIGIVPHRFAPQYQPYEVTSGRFNVSWVTLRNDDAGRACAADWADRVLARCAAAECGDQRYLDAWPARYGAALCAFVSPGIGVAPWNVFGYDLATVARDAPVTAWPAAHGDRLHVFGSPGLGVGPENVAGYRVADAHEVTVNDHPVVFYHYHEFDVARADDPPRCVRHDGFRLTLGYPLRPADVDVFYHDYCRRYRALAAALGC